MFDKWKIPYENVLLLIWRDASDGFTLCDSFRECTTDDEFIGWLNGACNNI